MDSDNQIKPKSTARIPILLSAFVCLGAGQLVQRRWLAASAYLLFFFAAFVDVMVTAGKIIASYYRMGFEFDTYEPEPVNLGNLQNLWFCCSGYWLSVIGYWVKPLRLQCIILITNNN